MLPFLHPQYGKDLHSVPAEAHKSSAAHLEDKEGRAFASVFSLCNCQENRTALHAARRAAHLGRHLIGHDRVLRYNLLPLGHNPLELRVLG